MSELTPAPPRSDGPTAAAARLLGVEPAERASVGLMLAHSFAMGLATVFFETAASALFLERFDSGVLPWVYLAAAAASAAAGAAYGRLQGRLSFGAQMRGTLAALLLGTLALRGGLWLSAAAAIPFLLMVWYRVISILTDLEFWAVATRLYDVRQSKRLFGVIGSGEVVARIAGAFSVPLVLSLTGVASLLLLSAAALGACLAVLGALLRRAEPAGTEAADPGSGESASQGLRSVLALPYLRLLVGIAFLAVLGKYFVDFAYLAEIRGRFGDARQLASFFALFSGVSQTLSLLTRLFLSRRVLSRWGVRAGLLVLPTVQLACTLLLLVTGLAGGAEVLLFWMVVANQGVYKTLKHPLDNPSFKILYQPIRREERLSTQVVVETVASPIAIALSGLVMMAFSRASAWSPGLFAIPMALCFAAWCWLAWRAGKAYARALVASLRGRLREVSYSFDDERNLPLLREALFGGQPREVLFALELIERRERAPGRRRHRKLPLHEPGEGHPGVPERLADAGRSRLLVELLGHASADVRAAVLLRMAARAQPELAEPVRRLLEREKVATVRAAGLRALAATGDEHDLQRIETYLDDDDNAVRNGALIGLLDRGRARDRLEALVASADPAQRERAARLLAEVGEADLSAAVARLLDDRDPRVSRLALIAVGRRRDAGLWDRLIDALREPHLAPAAARGLILGGEEMVPLIAKARAASSDPRILTHTARALGRLGGAEAAAGLEPQLDADDELVRGAALSALVACRATLGGEARQRGERQLEREVDDAEWTVGARRTLLADARLALLSDALSGEVQRNRDRILDLLALLYDREAVVRARRNLSHESRERRAWAAEVVDLSLPAALKPRVLPLLADAPRASAPAHRGGDARGIVAQLLARDAGRIGPWALACAADAAARLGATELSPRLEELESDSEHALVREMARSARVRLRTEAGDEDAAAAASGGRRMNTIERVLTLKSVDMFSLSTEESLADIAAILEEVEVASGEVIIRQGEMGDSMYIIIEGRVRVFDEERTFARLAERDIFGELALLDPEPRSAGVAAERPTRLFRLDREAFLELMASNIEIVRGVLQVLCKRLRRSVKSFGAY